MGGHEVVGASTVGVVDGRGMAVCASMVISCDGQSSMAGVVGVLGSESCCCCDWASLPAGCNDAARRISSRSTSANRPSLGRGGIRERHEAQTILASTGCGSDVSWRRKGMLAASAERGRRQVLHNLIWACGGSGGERSWGAGVACSAGIFVVAGTRRMGGGGRRGGSGRGQEGGECGRVLGCGLGVVDLFSNGQSGSSRGNQPLLLSILASALHIN